MKKGILVCITLFLTCSLFAKTINTLDFSFPLKAFDRTGILNNNSFETINFRTYVYSDKIPLIQSGFNVNVDIFEFSDSDDVISSFTFSPIISIYKQITPRFFLRGNLLFGYFTPVFFENEAGLVKKEKYQNILTNGFTFGTEIIASVYISPKFIVETGLSYNRKKDIFDTFSVTMGLSYSLASNLEQIDIEMLKSISILPVFYEYYNENPTLKIKVHNKERFPISKIKVNMKKTSITDKYKITLPVYIEAGETSEIIIPIKFKDSILKQTKLNTENLNITLNYKAGSASRSKNVVISLKTYSRNSFVWQTLLEDENEAFFNKVITENDGKVSVFVNPSDQNMIKLSHEIQNKYEDELGFDNINYNLKAIYKVVSYLQSRNIQYQIDPNSIPYDSQDITVDYLKFPAETLQSGFGDCDDLSLLCSQLMESAGVKCAFVTVPGHIFIAADSGMTEKEINSLFNDTSMFIEYNGSYYVPIEVTVCNKGFGYSWKMGIKEWDKYENEREFYPLEESWKQFRPVKIDILNNIHNYYPERKFKNNLIKAKNDLIEIALENDSNYASIAKKEYTFGRLNEAYEHIMLAIEEDPSEQNYYNAALISYNMNNIDNAIILLEEGYKVNENIKNKSLYKKLIPIDLVEEE